jgi:hypothetical protein
MELLTLLCITKSLGDFAAARYSLRISAVTFSRRAIIANLRVLNAPDAKILATSCVALFIRCTRSFKIIQVGRSGLAITFYVTQH